MLHEVVQHLLFPKNQRSDSARKLEKSPPLPKARPLETAASGILEPQPLGAAMRRSQLGLQAQEVLLSGHN